MKVIENTTQIAFFFFYDSFYINFIIITKYFICLGNSGILVAVCINPVSEKSVTSHKG